MLVGLNNKLSTEDDKDKKLELLQKIFELYGVLGEEVQEEDLDKAILYRMEACKTSGKIITLQEEDEREEMIEKAFELFNLLELNVKDKPKDERQAYFV